MKLYNSDSGSKLHTPPPQKKAYLFKDCRASFKRSSMNIYMLTVGMREAYFSTTWPPSF